DSRAKPITRLESVREEIRKVRKTSRLCLPTTSVAGARSFVVSIPAARLRQHLPEDLLDELPVRAALVPRHERLHRDAEVLLGRDPEPLRDRAPRVSDPPPGEGLGQVALPPRQLRTFARDEILPSALPELDDALLPHLDGALQDGEFLVELEIPAE